MSKRVTCLRVAWSFAMGLIAVDAAAESPAVSPLESVGTCTVRGTTSPKANAELYATSNGGAPIAKFTGVPLSLSVSAFPASPQGRARIETGSDSQPSLRLAGFTPTGTLRYFAKQAVPLVPGHVWLTKGLELRPLNASGDSLEFEHAVLGTRGQDGAPHTLRGKISCASVSLTPPTVEPAEAPKGVRWFHMKTDSVSLFDGPGGRPVLELRMDSEARKVFWSTDARNGWVHVLAPGDVTIDAWARASELEGLIHGEVFDMSSLEPAPLASPSLALAEPPKTLTATVELPILSKPEAAAPPLGVVSVGATFFAMDVSTVWTSVVPTDLAIMPIDGAGFWVKTSTLPKP